MNTLLIFIGAGIGGISRYWVSNLSYLLLGKNFPYGTLVVNVSSSLLMGIFFTLLLERYYMIAPQLRALLLIGFLGGFSTFSTFSMETFNLFENGALFSAFVNILANCVLCLIAVWLGVIGAKQL